MGGSFWGFFCFVLPDGFSKVSACLLWKESGLSKMVAAYEAVSDHGERSTKLSRKILVEEEKEAES